jgi:hypothetical protein
VAHSLLQCREEVDAKLSMLDAAQLVARPGGAASVAFHLTHAMGSLDRLLTYARGEQLSDTQLVALHAESGLEAQPQDGATLARRFASAVERALVQVRGTRGDNLLDSREVGRGRLPSTVVGLLFHAAEHTQRHVGQAVTTARIVRGMVRE